MSVISGKTGITVDDVASSFQLPRHTLSAVPGHRHARGLDAVLLTFDRKVQLALRSLCIERLELEARKRAMLERIVQQQSPSASSAPQRTPEMLITLNTKILDNDSNLRRLAGSAAGAVLDSLKDPEIAAGLQLDVPTEEEAGEGEDARVWRRRLDTHRVSRVDAPFRYASHDSPSVTGDRDLHNVLQSANPDEALSYYQKQQLKYGRGRRGSTSIAGAWDGVWDGNQEGSAPPPGGEAASNSFSATFATSASGNNGNTGMANGIGSALTRSAVMSAAGGGPRSRSSSPAPHAAGNSNNSSDAAAAQRSASPSRSGVPSPPPRPASSKDLNNFLGGASGSDENSNSSAGNDDPLSALLAKARQLVSEDAPHQQSSPLAASRSGQQNTVGAAAGHSSSSSSSGEDGEEDADIGDSASASGAAGQLQGLGVGATVGGFVGRNAAQARKSTFILQPSVLRGSPVAASHHHGGAGSASSADMDENEAGSALGGTATHSVLMTGGRKVSRRPTSATAAGLGFTGISGGGGDGGASVVTGRSAAAKSVITAFTVNTSGVLAMPRHTLSAKGAVAKSRGMEALLNSFPKMKQYAVREMAFDIAELVIRKETIEARMADDPLRRADDPPPKILLEVEEALGERVRRLVKLAGPEGAELVIAAVNDPVTREAMGLNTLEDEDEVREEAGDEDAARVWRRKLESRHVQPLRGVRGESAAALHDDPTSTGGKDLHNLLNRADPLDQMSYYQKQQFKYGRGRRGSTSIAGAWEVLFGELGERRGQADGNVGIGRGGDTSRLGGHQTRIAPPTQVGGGLGGTRGRWSGDKTREYAKRAASAPRQKIQAQLSDDGSATFVAQVTAGVRDPGVVSPARQARMVGGGGGGVPSSSRGASPAHIKSAVAAAANSGDVQALAELALQLASQLQAK